MASRRMFSIAIFNSRNFLTLPFQAQILYVFLCLNADDDGVSEAALVTRILGIKASFLNYLVQADLILIIHAENQIVYICDWLVHNSIRKDRYHPSIYADLLAQNVPNWHPVVAKRETQVSLSQSMEEKGRAEEDIKPQWWGMYRNIRLSQTEYDDLFNELPDFLVLLDEMSYYLNKKNQTYSDYPAAFRRWQDNKNHGFNTQDGELDS